MIGAESKVVNFFGYLSFVIFLLQFLSLIGLVTSGGGGHPPGILAAPYIVFIAPVGFLLGLVNAINPPRNGTCAFIGVVGNLLLAGIGAWLTYGHF